MVHALDVQRMAILVNGDHNRQADGRFRRGDDNHKEDEYQSVQLIPRARERHECQIYGVQHQLDGHEDRDDVPLEHECHHAQSKKNGTQHQVIGNRNDAHSSLFARTSAPRMAIKIKMEVASNGNKYFWKSCIDNSRVETITFADPAPLAGVRPISECAIQCASSRSSRMPSGSPAYFAILLQSVRSSVPAFSSMITKTKRTMIAPAYTMICTAAMNSAPSIRYRPASDIITRISASALWIGSRAIINSIAPPTEISAKTKNRMKGKLIRASPATGKQSTARSRPDSRARPAAAASSRATSTDRSESAAKFRESKRRRKSSRRLSAETRTAPAPRPSPRAASIRRRERAHQK